MGRIYLPAGRKTHVFACKINGKQVLRSTRETDRVKAHAQKPKWERWADLQRNSPDGLLTLEKAAVTMVEEIAK